MTKNIQTVPSWAEPWGGGWLWRPRGPGHSGWHRGTSQNGTLRMGQFGRRGASVCAHGLARGGVRACVRETVCAITFMAVFLQFCSSWSSHRLWTSHSSKDLLHHLILVSSNKPGQTACQQHPDQLFQTRQRQNRTQVKHINAEHW